LSGCRLWAQCPGHAPVGLAVGTLTWREDRGARNCSKNNHSTSNAWHGCPAPISKMILLHEKFEARMVFKKHGKPWGSENQRRMRKRLKTGRKGTDTQWQFIRLFFHFLLTFQGLIIKRLETAIRFHQVLSGVTINLTCITHCSHL
jgi:hypothetical protein